MMALLRFWIFAHLLRLTEILLELHVNFRGFGPELGPEGPPTRCRLDVQLDGEHLELRATSAVDVLAWAERLRAALSGSEQLARKSKKMIAEEAKAHVEYAKHVL